MAPLTTYRSSSPVVVEVEELGVPGPAGRRGAPLDIGRRAIRGESPLLCLGDVEHVRLAHEHAGHGPQVEVQFGIDVRQDVLVVLHERGDVGDVDLRESVAVQVRDADVHGMKGVGDPQRGGPVFKSPVAEIPEEGVSSKVVGDDDVLPTVLVEVCVRDGLCPPGIGEVGAVGDLLESQPAEIAEELVGQCVGVVAVHAGRMVEQVVPEVADVDVQQTIAVEIEHRGRTSDELFAAEPGAAGDVLEAVPVKVLVQAMGGVGARDQDVLQAVVVEIDDQRLTRFGGLAVRIREDQAGSLGNVGELPGSVAEVQRVARPSDKQ